MKKIIISERLERLLFQTILNEEIAYMGDKEDIVVKWLDEHFKPMENETSDDMGLPKVEKIVGILDSKKEKIIKLISLERVYFMLQTKFQRILQDTKERDEFLWKTLNKWYK
jgi:hypothetical protein